MRTLLLAGLAVLGVMLAAQTPANAAGGLGYTSPGAGESILLRPVAANDTVSLPDPRRRPVMPQVVFQGPGNVPGTLDQFRGKVLVVNLWATWCVPCIRELPGLSLLQGALGERGLKVVTIAIEPNGVSTVQSFFKSQKITGLPPYADQTQASVAALGARGLPTTYIVDRQMRLVTRLEGERKWDSEDILSVIGQLLAEKG